MEYNIKPVDRKKNKPILGTMVIHIILLNIRISCKSWALTFVMRGFWLSKKLSIEVGFAFSNKGLKSQDLRFRMKKKLIICSFFIMFNDVRFGLVIFTTNLTYLCLQCLFHMENHINRVTTAQC